MDERGVVLSDQERERFEAIVEAFGVPSRFRVTGRAAVRRLAGSVAAMAAIAIVGLIAVVVGLARSLTVAAVGYLVLLIGTLALASGPLPARLAVRARRRLAAIARWCAAKPSE